MAEGLFRRRLTERGIGASVRSCGLVTEGQPASAHSVSAMARRGIDIEAHRSRLLERSLVHGADLVVGMERQHVREAVVLDPDAFIKSFTLPELVRRGRAIGERKPAEPVGDWLARAAAGRLPTDLLGHDPADEIADPIGRSAKRYEQTATELESLVHAAVDLLFPDPPRD